MQNGKNLKTLFISYKQKGEIIFSTQKNIKFIYSKNAFRDID